MYESASILNLRTNTNMWIQIERDDRKAFDKPWFYTNWVVFNVALLLTAVEKIRHRDSSIPAALGFFGMALISIAIHAVYAGSFAIRGSAVSREDDAVQFWCAVMTFVLLGLFMLPLAWGGS